MARINGVNMPNFTHKEIPPGIAEFINESILKSIQEYRYILGCPFNISLADGALIRFDGRKTSEHHVIIDPITEKPIKLSRAIDGFPDCDIFEAWTKALSCNLFAGIGVYFDTKNNHGIPQPMLHLDLRPFPLVWYRDDGQYFYPHRNKDFFQGLMNLFITHKEK